MAAPGAGHPILSNWSNGEFPAVAAIVSHGDAAAVPKENEGEILGAC